MVVKCKSVWFNGRGLRGVSKNWLFILYLDHQEGAWLHELSLCG